MATVDLGDWSEQWKRAKRWHRRLQPIREGKASAHYTREEQIDTVLAFFMVCYHLADAIHVSKLQAKKDVDAYVKGNDALSLCRDLCIAVKHFEVSEPYRPTGILSTATVFPAYRSGGLPLPDTPPQAKWVVKTDSGQKDMFDLADECIAAWSRYLPAPAN